jgi:hypothetical protein
MSIRYNIRGKPISWVLNKTNGWIRVYDTIVRWNTNWTQPYTVFSITKAKR